MSVTTCRLFLLLALLGLPNMASAAEPGKKAALSGEVYYWYDGEARRTVRLEAPADAGSPETSSAAQPATDMVFRDGGVRMTLPGGVIANFPKGWERARIDEWMSQRGVSSYRKVRGGNTWMIDTEPGLPSLEFANRLHESGEVIYASPNWRVERKRR